MRPKLLRWLPVVLWLPLAGCITEPAPDEPTVFGHISTAKEASKKKQPPLGVVTSRDE